MLRFFEQLVDPYTPYEETNTPPTRLWQFLREYSKPFKKVFVCAGLMSVVVAAVEVALIFYMGRIVDLLGATTPADFWAENGFELILVAAAILLLRPALQALDVLSGNTDVHFLALQATLALSQTNSFCDGVDRLFDVRNDSAQYTFAFDFAKAQDFQLAMLITPPYDRAYLGGTDVDRYDGVVRWVYMFCFHCIPFLNKK